MAVIVLSGAAASAGEFRSVLHCLLPLRTASAGLTSGEWDLTETPTSESASTAGSVSNPSPPNSTCCAGTMDFSFGDIAAIIGTTRANIHHHFGSKRLLMDELVEDISANAQARIERHWTAGETSLSDRLQLQLDDLRRFYERFNPARSDRNVWSPLSRLRHDLGHAW